MAIKKTELYSSLWQSCDELRGSMDASQYKDYVLTLLFMKYVSDKYAGDPKGMIRVPEGGSFEDMVELKGDKEIGDKINKIIGKLAEANDLKNVIDVADFNDEDKLGKDKRMVDTLSKLVGIFDGLDLGSNRAEHDDLLGDAYEYLMRHFATESGKSKGQFYTPAEVSRILAKVLGINKETRQDQTIYDPTCGSGSLLLKAADEAPRGMTIYGQENDNATAALARMNMILHDNPTAEIWQDNTLSDPHWKDKDSSLKTFDFAVANPPFSFKSWSNGVNTADDEYGRFEYGTPPEKNGDYAFLLHIIKSLKSTGKAAVILPHGVLFRGNVEAGIRLKLIRQGYIEGIIGLPANLFYGTGIPACLIVIDKAQAKQRLKAKHGGIFMIDASKGFMKEGNKNRLRSQDIHKIVDVFTRQIDSDSKYARLVPFTEIESNDYNLNIPRYIDSAEPEDLHDLHGHLNGGIPNRDIDALHDYWRVFPSLRSLLFEPSERSEKKDAYSECSVEAEKVKATILDHPEFNAFADKALALYTNWKTAHAKRLNQLKAGENVKALIHELSEDLLQRFAKADLISKYDIYQLLMDYWDETMQDDVYLLAQDGWQAANVVRQLVPSKDKSGKNVYKEDHDFEFKKVRFKSDILPPQLVINRYFSEQQQQLDEMQLQLDEAGQTLEAFIEENSGEEGYIDEVKNNKGKVTKKNIDDRLKNTTDKDEIAALKECLKLVANEAKSKKAVKDAKAALDQLVYEKVPKIPQKEVKILVVDDKWQATIEAAIQAEIERVTKQLANRVRLLEERYAEPMPKLTEDIAILSSKVDSHLKKMGLAW